MNICLISPAFYPLIGGGETHVRTLASGLTRLGHHVVVVTNLYDSSLSQCEIIDGVEVLRTYSYLKYINAPGRVPWEECLFGLLRDIEEFLAGRTIDIIHAHCQASAILGAMIKTQWRCPLLITFHETQPELEPFGTSRSHMLYSHLPYEQIIATSHFFQEQALHFGADSRRVRLIYHGVDVDRFSPEQSGTHIRARLGVNADQPLVLLAGRFKERKGILEFVRAMAEVSHRYPKARGLITGGYNSASLEYAERVRSEIEQLRLAHIITFQQEPFPWEDMPALFACADLIIQPSYTE
ncbi:MAG TPA: glycosyltransferase family 4 protein, partial [Ktedonobacteraceae bacterium]|nr:glycosyltransferase family 4 protein [Ktedonobacteraceae bacterium]